MCLFYTMVFSGGIRPGSVQVFALLPTQEDAESSIHASGPGAQRGPRLAPKTNHHHRSQALPRKWLYLSDQFLAPPTPPTLSNDHFCASSINWSELVTTRHYSRLKNKYWLHTYQIKFSCDFRTTLCFRHVFVLLLSGVAFVTFHLKKKIKRLNAVC